MYAKPFIKVPKRLFYLIAGGTLEDKENYLIPEFRRDMPKSVRNLLLNILCYKLDTQLSIKEDDEYEYAENEIIYAKLFPDHSHKIKEYMKKNLLMRLNISYFCCISGLERRQFLSALSILDDFGIIDAWKVSDSSFDAGKYVYMIFNPVYLALDMNNPRSYVEYTYNEIISITGALTEKEYKIYKDEAIAANKPILSLCLRERRNTALSKNAGKLCLHIRNLLAGKAMLTISLKAFKQMLAGYFYPSIILKLLDEISGITDSVEYYVFEGFITISNKTVSKIKEEKEQFTKKAQSIISERIGRLKECISLSTDNKTISKLTNRAKTHSIACIIDTLEEVRATYTGSDSVLRSPIQSITLSLSPIIFRKQIC